MAMTRRALLISNPGEVGEENYCKGVYVDIKNYQRLMTSSVGGAWELGEIQHLDRPSRADVRWWLKAFSVHDYVLVMFTGHGWYSSTDKDRILILRKGEEIASMELNQGAIKRTIILDCCQVVYHESIEKVAKHMIFANEARMRITPNRDTCRRLFFGRLEKTTNEIVRMKSCAIDEKSGDDEERGGRYNGSLFECVDDWVEWHASGRADANNSVLSVVQAHVCATEKTIALSEGNQNPKISKPKEPPYFPFAVFG